MCDSFILFLLPWFFLISGVLPLELQCCPPSAESITAEAGLYRPDRNTDWETARSVLSWINVC